MPLSNLQLAQPYNALAPGPGVMQPEDFVNLQGSMQKNTIQQMAIEQDRALKNVLSSPLNYDDKGRLNAVGLRGLAQAGHADKAAVIQHNYSLADQEETKSRVNAVEAFLKTNKVAEGEIDALYDSAFSLNRQYEAAKAKFGPDAALRLMNEKIVPEAYESLSKRVRPEIAAKLGKTYDPDMAPIALQGMQGYGRWLKEQEVLSKVDARDQTPIIKEAAFLADPNVPEDQKAIVRADIAKRHTPAAIQVATATSPDTGLPVAGWVDMVDPESGQRIQVNPNTPMVRMYDPKTGQWGVGVGNLDFSKLRPLGKGGGLIDQETIQSMAKQAWTGDTSVFHNLGRGTQGADNIVALRRAVREEGERLGKTPEELSAKNAEFFGIKAGERTLGTRQANVDLAVTEALNIIPLALKASDELKRTDIKAVNDLIQFAQSKTASAELRRLAAATNTFINVYARAISPVGVPTINDKEHAREVLDKGFSNGDYKAAVDILVQEMYAARAAPGQVRKDLNEAITGRPSAAKSPPPSPESNKVTTPDGQVHIFPSAEAAAQFKKAAGLP